MLANTFNFHEPRFSLGYILITNILRLVKKWNKRLDPGAREIWGQVQFYGVWWFSYLFILASKTNTCLFFIVKSHDNQNLFCSFLLENLALSTFSQTWLIGRRDLGDLDPIWSHLPHSVTCAFHAPSPDALRQLPQATLSQSRSHPPFTPPARDFQSCTMLGGYTMGTQCRFFESKTVTSLCVLKHFTTSSTVCAIVCASAPLLLTSSDAPKIYAKHVS